MFVLDFVFQLTALTLGVVVLFSCGLVVFASI